MKTPPKAKLYNGLIRYECRNGLGFNNSLVISCLDKLEMIPLGLQEAFSKGGLDIVFFNGQLTDNSELAFAKGKKPRGWDKGDIWDKTGCAYDPNLKRVFIGVKGDYYPLALGINDIFLHELGHGFDEIIGEYFYNKPLSRIKKIRTAVEKESFESSYYYYPTEYVANSVDLFYRNYYSRGKLKENQLTIFELLEGINRFFK